MQRWIRLPGLQLRAGRFSASGCGLAPAAAATGGWKANPDFKELIVKRLQVFTLNLKLGVGNDGSVASRDVLVLNKGQRNKLVGHLKVIKVHQHLTN